MAILIRYEQGYDLTLETSGAVSCPRVVCDHCGRVIENAAEGNVLWLAEESTADLSHHRLNYVHKSCGVAFEADEFYFWMPLDEMILCLFRNTGMQPPRQAIESTRHNSAPAAPRGKARKLLTYFIRSEHGGPVKIGKSVNPQARLSSLQTGRHDRLVILKTVNGDREAEFHRKFQEFHESGEWFRCEGSLLEFVSKED